MRNIIIIIIAVLTFTVSSAEATRVLLDLATFDEVAAKNNIVVVNEQVCSFDSQNSFAHFNCPDGISYPATGTINGKFAIFKISAEKGISGYVVGHLVGDVNNDGATDLEDAIIHLKVFVGIQTNEVKTIRGELPEYDPAKGVIVNRVSLSTLPLILQVVAVIR